MHIKDCEEEYDEPDDLCEEDLDFNFDFDKSEMSDYERNLADGMDENEAAFDAAFNKY